MENEDEAITAPPVPQAPTGDPDSPPAVPIPTPDVRRHVVDCVLYEDPKNTWGSKHLLYVPDLVGDATVCAVHGDPSLSGSSTLVNLLTLWSEQAIWCFQAGMAGGSALLGVEVVFEGSTITINFPPSATGDGHGLSLPFNTRPNQVLHDHRSRGR